MVVLDDGVVRGGVKDAGAGLYFGYFAAGVPHQESRIPPSEFLTFQAENLLAVAFQTRNWPTR